jgi:hypothetical protein
LNFDVVESIDVDDGEHASNSFTGTTATIWMTDRERDAESRQGDTLNIVAVPFEYTMEWVVLVFRDHTRTTTIEWYNAGCTFIESKLSRSAPAGANLVDSLKGKKVFKELVTSFPPFLKMVVLGLPNEI